MTPNDLTSRVSRDACVLGVAVAGPAAWLGGLDGARGAAAGAGIPDHVTYTWLVMIILAGIAFMATRRLELVPRGAQNAMEIVLEQLQQTIEDVMGPAGRPYLPLIATLGLFIFTANLMSLVPGLAGPTTNLNTTAACALIVFFTYHAVGVRKQGVVNYIKHFMG